MYISLFLNIVFTISIWTAIALLVLTFEQVYIVMPPTSKLEGHIALGHLSICLHIHEAFLVNNISW